MTHSTFIQVSLFPDRPPTNPEFHDVEFTVIGGHHVSTSAGAGGLLCALRVRARVNARLHARPKFPRARLRVVLMLSHNPKFPNKTPFGTAATAALLRSFLSNSRRKPSHGRLDRVSEILSSKKQTLGGLGGSCCHPGGLCDNPGGLCCSPGGLCFGPGGLCDNAGGLCFSPGGLCWSSGGLG